MNPQPAPLRSFRDDHRRVLARISSLEEAVFPPRHSGRLTARAEAALRETVALLERQFATHMATEEQVLYPALAEVLPEAGPSLIPLRAEHGELRSMLARLAQLVREDAGAPRDEQILVQVRDLVDLLRIHIHKEEAAVFTMAVRVLSPREIETLSDRVAVHHATPPRARMRRPGTKGPRP